MIAAAPYHALVDTSAGTVAGAPYTLEKVRRWNIGHRRHVRELTGRVYYCGRYFDTFRALVAWRVAQQPEDRRVWLLLDSGGTFESRDTADYYRAHASGAFVGAVDYSGGVA